MGVKGDRLFPMLMPTKLQRRLTTATEGRSVQQVADEMGIPYWTIRDTLSGRIQCPIAKHLPSMARWLGLTTDQLIAEAYTEESTSRGEPVTV